ncbi:hypothetical protein TWF281_004150 [Arthrobotrys megalospora]
MEPRIGQRSSPPIETLPPELLSEIISHVSREDLTPLLRVCRRFYDAAYPYIWRTIRYDPPKGRRQSSRQYQDKLEKLVRITEDVGVDAMGFHHIKELIFQAGDLSPGSF